MITTIYGLLSANRALASDYTLTWNSTEFNTVDGDPLQISTTDAAIFLNQNVT